MRTLIFDIETIGEDFDALDAVTQSVLTRWIKEDLLSAEEYQATLEDFKKGLGFSPWTGEVVAIGMLDYEQDKAAVYFQAPEEDFGSFEEAGVLYKQMTEKEMLEQLWKVAAEYDLFVTFNGRGFDVPFLSVRSGVHSVRPTKNLLANRYLNLQPTGAKHVDLQDQFTFYGAMYRRPSLHISTRAFGIKSPKEDGLDGDHVTEFFKAKRYKEIAQYNVRDIRATRDLYERWEKYVKF